MANGLLSGSVLELEFVYSIYIDVCPPRYIENFQSKTEEHSRCLLEKVHSI